jgi:ATP-dependent DNA ligase
VVDGELCIFLEGHLDFDALQKRLVTGPAKVRSLVAAQPATFMAFDLLAAGGVDLRMQRWTVRRGRLEQLAEAWAPPIQLTPVTADLEEARDWFDALPAAIGMEGLVVKGAATRYLPGSRNAWGQGEAQRHPRGAGRRGTGARSGGRRW